MTTSGDEALEAALEHLKVRNSDYLRNQNLATHSNLTGAMGRQARALASKRGMLKQTSEMRKVKQDFEDTKNSRKKISIAHTLAKTLVRMTVRKLALWTILSSSSAASLGYAMYDINTKGEVIDWTDSTGDGVLDSALVDTDGVPGGEYVVQDIDANGSIDKVLELDENGAVVENMMNGVEDSGIFESVFAILGSFF